MISRKLSSKAIEKQVAINMLVFPHCIQDTIAPRSLQAFDYLLRFEEADGAFTNLAAELVMAWPPSVREKHQSG